MSNFIVDNADALDETAEKKEAIESGTYTGTQFMYNILSLKVQFLLKKNYKLIPLTTYITIFTTHLCVVCSGYIPIKLIFKYSLSCIFH